MCVCVCLPLPLKRYDEIKLLFSRDPQPPFWLKLFAGSAAGGIGAMTASPFDLALVRMQADGRLPAGQRRNYVRCRFRGARLTRR